ncbi:MAG: DUF58 domain-containing protein [Bacillota bacterium]
MPRYISSIGTTFLLLLTAGFLFANNILILVSVIPLSLMAFGYFLKVPADVKVKKSVSKSRIAVGELLDITVLISVESGFGPLEVCDVVPAHFELVDGNNFCVLWKGLEAREVCLTYTVKCTASGTYPFKLTKWRSKHPICSFSVNDQYESELSVEVTPRLLELKRIRGMATACKVPMPQGALSSMGMTTQEFKEIRLYYPGDPFKSINWKVTSRNLLRGNIWPVVNQFEKEGKKSVWIFLDASKVMAYGSNIKNVREYSVEAVNSLCDYYIRQNCSISFLTYGGRDIFVHSGSGRQHHYKILRELLNIKNYSLDSRKPQEKSKSLDEKVYSCRNYFVGLRPLFVIVTRFCTNNCDDLKKGIDTMSRYTMRNGLLPSIMVVNIVGYGLMAENQSEKLASNLLEAMNKVVSKEIRKNCIWVDWDPVKESLTGALLKQVVTR